MEYGNEENTGAVERLLKDLEIENPTRFSPAQLKTFTSDFSHSLGSGGFGGVYKGRLSNGMQVAVKVLKGALVSDGVKNQFKAEVSVLVRTRHRNLVKLYGYCFERDMIALVYEFMENGSLEKILYRSQSVKWETLCDIVIVAANGLSYLHKGCQPSIIHYDIKPSNILLDSEFSPKVGDFGLAKLLDQGKTHITESRLRGTRNYAAPELLLPYASATHKCDVYSFGITLFDIIGRKRTVAGEGEKWFPRQVWKKFEEERHDEVMEECGIQEENREQAKRMLLLAMWCAQFLPDNRPSMSHVVRILEGKEEIVMPPNPFSLLGSSSKTEIERSTRKGLPSRLKPVTVGPWGGPGGGHWDDGVYAGIKQIQVYRESLEIRSVQIEYAGKDGDSIWSERHGYTGAHTIDTIEFDYPSEILKKVTGFYAFQFGENKGFILLRSLSFFTNKKKYGPFGDEKGTYFTSGKDGKVVGFHGRCGAYVDAIGLHMEYSSL